MVCRTPALIILRKHMLLLFQLAFYDQIKHLVMKTGYAKDNLPTHFTCSFLAVSTL